ncbi:ABC transporter permease [Pseudochryseolinea flava]|uniref:ABC transporter permease n=1 Tax=Pseudochryseolinea flava TaxID=2059302 RepID=A0A364Y636_9BACT|nr:DUF3526 domain-containing protein [Pseudochryseolinea flava]RAW02423.1 ABC transporter permease [Pseudochryseolinea flava]
MRKNIVVLIARQFMMQVFKSSVFYALLLIVIAMLMFAAYSGWHSYTVQNEIRTHYQQEARKSWESNPDKHPHRMAHYGTFAFRLKHALSMFDFGMESYTGNAVFLEAHKQNSVNFSEASFSTGLLRFGEISVAMVLQVVIPLIVFFLGFSSVAAERQMGTLKVILIQGASWKELLVGKSTGLMMITTLFYIPAVVVIFFLLLFEGSMESDIMLRYGAIFLFYFIFYVIVSVVTIVISTLSRSSKDALITSLGIWLVFVVLLPRTAQAVGSYFYPAPAKVTFESAIEEDVIRQGDSHDPNDPHFKAIKDSLLHAHGVDSVQHLPFNYSGFIMREGERLSAVTYQRHLKELLGIYERQNDVGKIIAVLNPYMAIRNLSMAFSGSDLFAYQHFQQQAESYRYELAQTMNELQMKYIGNEKEKKGEKPHAIGKEHWMAFPDFKYKFQPFIHIAGTQVWSIASLVLWCVVVFFVVVKVSKTVKVIQNV